jgi:hypothetical protein
MFICIQKEEKSTFSRINDYKVLLLKPKNVAVLNVIKCMVKNTIPIKISLLQTSAVFLSVSEHLFQTFVSEAVQQLHATCTLKHIPTVT